MPGDPCLILPGGKGLDRIGAHVSVNPIVSIMVILNFSSNCLCVSGARAAEALLPNRTWDKFKLLISSSENLFNKELIIVGTMLNHVQLKVLINFQKLVTEKRSHKINEL